MKVRSHILDEALHSLPGTILCHYGLVDSRLHEAQGKRTGVGTRAGWTLAGGGWAMGQHNPVPPTNACQVPYHARWMLVTGAWLPGFG